MNNRLHTFGWLTVVCLASASGRIAADDVRPGNFKRHVQPLLVKYCYGCHGAKKKSADLSLQGLDSDLVKGKDAESWHDVLNKLNLGQMPPKKAAQPTASERATIVKWLNAELQRAAAAKRSTGGRVVMRRLTRYEYANTMRDLLGIDLDYAADLPPESVSVDGFRNNGRTLGMSPLQLEIYLKTARRALGKAIVTGPRPRVYKYQTEKSVKTRRRRNAAATGNRMPPGGQFLAKLTEFPREGEFIIRVKASARSGKGNAWPRLSVAVGVRADVRAPKKTVNEIDIDATLGNSRVYTFRGRMEDFPQPGKNPKFPGLLITLTHESDTALPPGKRRRKRNRNKKQPKKEDPNQPLIVIDRVEFAGPIFDAWPPSSHTRIMLPSKSTGDKSAYAREIVTRFMRRAYRRPIRKPEADRMMALFATIRKRSDSFEAAIRDVLAVVLISPDFLYLLEPPTTGKPGQTAQPLSDHQIAARLSYFLWGTMPDARLSRLADQGTLRDGKILAKLVRSMIADNRSQRFVKHFTDQWLDLSGLDRVAINPEYYPKFNDRLKRDMRLETEHFFAEILRKDLSALNLLDSKFAMLNNPLAKHYGLAGPRGRAFERVALKPSDHRGGLLAQASMLLINSTGEDSHPIRRAVWIRKRLLDDTPPPPPPDVPELNSKQPDFAALPLKKQLEIHRKKAACYSCHKTIDPWGIPLENYDAVGRWRTKVVKPAGGKRRRKNRTKTSPVDAVGEFPDGTKLAGIQALQQHLLTKERDRFARAVVKKLFAYALGRSAELSDRKTIDQLAKQFAEKEYRLSDLIVAIVQSRQFQTK